MIIVSLLPLFRIICFFNLLFIFGNLYSITSKSTYKKLINKRLINKGDYHEGLNLFQCFNACEKNNNCKIFNYNSGMKICQLTDKKADENGDNFIYSYGWDIYFPTMKEKLIKVMEFKNQTSDTQIMVPINNRTDLSTCFWFKQDDDQNYRTFFTLYADHPCTFVSFRINNNKNRMRFFLLTYFYGRLEKASFKDVLDNATGRFYHTCLVYSHKRFYFYIDGQIHDDVGFSMQDNEVTFKFMWIGKPFRYSQFCIPSDETAFVNASLYDFSLYITNLTQSEIAYIINGNSMVSPLLSWENVKARYVNDSAAVLKQVKLSQIRGEN